MTGGSVWVKMAKNGILGPKDTLKFISKFNFSKNTVAELLAGAKHTALQVGWSQGQWWHVIGTVQKTKLSITRSNFEKEARNFAW